MAITYMDNYGAFGTTAAYLLNGLYASLASATLVDDPDGKSPGKVLELVADAGIFGGGHARRVLQALATTSGQARRIWLNRLPGNAEEAPVPFSFGTAANVEIVTFTVTPSGRIRATYNPTSTTLGETANPVITANGWYHLEAKVEINGAAGKVELRVEGRPVLVIDGVNLGATPIGMNAIRNYQSSAGTGARIYTKDYITWDGTGPRNNDFTGTRFVTELLTDADVALNWTITGGANAYSILRNSPPTDAQYISAGDPPPGAYVASLTDLPDDVTSIAALMTLTRAAKVDGGDASLQVSLISDPEGVPATTNGADRPITVGQTYWTDIFETDPKTSVQWTPEAVNEVHLKLNRTV